MPPITIYCTPTDLTDHGISDDAIAAMDPAEVLRVIEAQARLMDGSFKKRYALPFTAIDASVTECNAVLAAYRLLVKRGYNPAAGADENIRLGYTDKLKWLERVAAGLASPNVQDSSGDIAVVDGTRGAVVSSSSRGWSDRGLSQFTPGGFVRD